MNASCRARLAGTSCHQNLSRRFRDLDEMKEQIPWIGVYSGRRGGPIPLASSTVLEITLEDVIFAHRGF